MAVQAELTDIVARLRDPRWTHPPHSLLLEAADEIERLRKSPDKALMERVVAFINETDPFGDRFSAHDLERLSSGKPKEPPPPPDERGITFHGGWGRRR